MKRGFLTLNMKEGELRVFYKVKDRINMQFDRELSDLCKKFGFTWWASGFDREEEIRDIAFDLREKEGPLPVYPAYGEQIPSFGQAPPIILVKGGVEKQPVTDRKMVFQALADIDKRLKVLEGYIIGAQGAKDPSAKDPKSDKQKQPGEGGCGATLSGIGSEFPKKEE